jgi:hypothetical protein
LQLVKGLEEAVGLIERGKALEARELLESLDKRYPNQPDVLGLLVNANYDLQDTASYQYACERLLRVTPNDLDVAIGLAGAVPAQRTAGAGAAPVSQLP